jgi:hypothetical protein
MEEIILNKEEFKLFDQGDQFGFFYDEDGWPKENADDEFDSNVEELFKKYDSISIDKQDNIYGLKGGKKVTELRDVPEAYDIAREIKE